MNVQADEFFRNAKAWREEYRHLRSIVLDCHLNEEFKWMHPCYTLDGKNVVLIHGFKDYCALLFMKGALLQDPENILIQQTESVQAGRQIRFTNLQQIAGMEDTLKAYIREAIVIEQSDRKVKLKTEFTIPEELQRKFDEVPTLQSSFAALTPGRQRAYLLYFSRPKQSKTRAARVDRYVRHILDGRGLND